MHEKSYNNKYGASYLLNINPVANEPTRYPKNPNVQSKLMVSFSTPTFWATLI